MWALISDHLQRQSTTQAEAATQPDLSGAKEELFMVLVSCDESGWRGRDCSGLSLCPWPLHNPEGLKLDCGDLVLVQNRSRILNNLVIVERCWEDIGMRVELKYPEPRPNEPNDDIPHFYILHFGPWLIHAPVLFYQTDIPIAARYELIAACRMGTAYLTDEKDEKEEMKLFVSSFAEVH